MELTTNSQRFRGQREFPRTPEPGRVRIATLGDSFSVHQNIAVSEGLFISFLKAEGVGFMRHFGGQNVERH